MSPEFSCFPPDHQEVEPVALLYTGQNALHYPRLCVLRAGLHLGTVNRGRFEPSHALAMALRREEVRRVTEFAGDSPEAYAWIRGESVNALDTAEKGWTLVLIDGCSAGWAKASGGMLKNHYPKGIRKGSSYRKP